MTIDGVDAAWLDVTPCWQGPLPGFGLWRRLLARHRALSSDGFTLTGWANMRLRSSSTYRVAPERP